MNAKENTFLDTEDTKLKRFLKGEKIYSMLVLAIVCAIIFAFSLAAIIRIFINVEAAKSIKNIHEINVYSDLDNQYVEGDVYKFIAQLGYIATSEAAATEYYYLMYLDNDDGNEYAVMVEAPIEGDADLQDVISAYLAYAKDPDSGYMGNIISISGRFRSMTNNEKTLFNEGISQCAVTDTALGYVFEVGEIPVGRDTIPYFLFAIPSFAGLAIGVAFFLYGRKLEAKREKANESPYPYLNKNKKKKK